MHFGFSRRTAAGFVLALSVGMTARSGLLAQGIITGSITGTVGDPTGAVVPGADVVLSNPATGIQYKSKTKADGTFNVDNLPVGKYTVMISGAGFSALTLQNVEVDANRTQALGLEKLQTGNASETVEVSAASNLLETTESQVTTTFQSQQLASLPLGSGFDEVALLIPGVVATHGDNFSNTNGTGFSSNGQSGRANNFELDGQSNNDNSIAGPQAFFGNDEAIAQIQVISNDFGAQYGRNSGTVVNYITKSGTNQIHGSAIYRYSGDFTSSLETGVSKGPQFGFCASGEDPSDGCTPTVVPRYVSNKWGGTIGAPIIKDKLFAFGSTWWQHFYEFGGLVQSGTSLFPTQAGLQQLAAAFPGNKAVGILQQLSPYAVTAGNPRQLPSTNSACPGGICNEQVSYNGTTITVPFAPFGRQVPQVTTDEEDLGRLDYQATPKDRLYLRYFYQTNPTAPDGATANGGYVNVRDAVHSVGADITHTFSSRWTDQLRYSFQQSTLAFDGGGFANCTISNFNACPSGVTIGSVGVAGVGSGVLQESGLGLPNNLPQGRVVKVTQVQDNATWAIGHHAITFGGEYDYQNSPNTFLPYAQGVFTYTNFNNFLADNGSLNLAQGSPTIPFKENDAAAYFQDDWKVSSGLTLNLGLRWEFFQQALNLLHTESVAQQTGTLPFWNTALPLSQTTFPAVNQVYRNFEPRLGFAYNPEFMKKLVVRGGYAINVNPGFYNINLDAAASAPVVNSSTITCTGQCQPTGGATYATVATQDYPLAPRGGNPGDRKETLVPSNFKQPINQTYTLAVEYQIAGAAVLEVRYTGTHTSSNFQAIDANPYLAPLAAAFPNYVSPSSLCSLANSTLPDHADVGHVSCGSTTVRQFENTGFSVYNGLQMSLTTHNFHGASMTFAYTHSRTIDNATDIFATLGAGVTSPYAQNPLNTNYGERSVSGNDFPNAASISMVYAIPAPGRASSFVGHLTHGWQANTIWTYNSGQPYNDFDLYQSQSPVVNPNDVNTYETYSDIPFVKAFGSGGVDFARPILSNPNAPVGTLGIYTDTGGSNGTPLSAPQLVDYASGKPVTPSQVRFIASNRLAANLLGNPYPGSARNLLRGDTWNDVDFSVFKDTHITERVTFRLEANAYNVLNRSFFGYETAGTPDANQGDYTAGSFNNQLYSSASGSLVGPGTGVRNMEFGAKILF